jgi:hypothetical protein
MPKRRSQDTPPARLHRFDFGRVAETVENDAGAFAGKRARDAQANAAGRAGDEGGLAFQLHV